MYDVHCRVVSNELLPKDLLKSLTITVVRMLDRKERTMCLTEDEHGCNGSMTTNNECGVMGSEVGIMFKANLEFEGHRVHVEFIVKPMKNPEALDIGALTGVPDILGKDPNPALN